MVGGLFTLPSPVIVFAILNERIKNQTPPHAHTHTYTHMRKPYKAI